MSIHRGSRTFYMNEIELTKLNEVKAYNNAFSCSFLAWNFPKQFPSPAQAGAGWPRGTKSGMCCGSAVTLHPAQPSPAQLSPASTKSYFIASLPPDCILTNSLTLKLVGSLLTQLETQSSCPHVIMCHQSWQDVSTAKQCNVKVNTNKTKCSPLTFPP